ncbi:hypothetical protein ACLB2K_003520 [Fragaria x ananassa]
MFSSQKLPSYYEPKKSSYHPDQLLLRISIHGFSKLSVSDQRLHTEEIRKKVVENVAVEQLSEESDEGFRIRTFTELLKKLPSAYKHIFVTKIIKQFMHERQFGELISTFKHLEAKDQQKAIEIIVQVAPEKNLQNPGEADEDFRLRRFTHLTAFLNVLDFPTIWFQGQSSDYQKEMIEKQLGGSTVGGGIVENESEEDFQLRSFTTLYRKKVVNFHSQVEFLDFLMRDCFGRKVVFRTKDSSCLKILKVLLSYSRVSQVATFGFCILFEKEQQDRIEEMSKEVRSSCVIQENEEGFRKARFKELFSELPVSG